MKKYYLPITICFLAILVLITSQSSLRANTKKDTSDGFWVWFEWKLNHPDNDEQKTIIKYFKKINKIFEEANSTVYIKEGSDLGLPDPQQALNIIKETLKEANLIEPPKVCMKHYDLTLKILNYRLSYHGIRLELGDKLLDLKMQRDSEFEKKMRDMQIEESELEADRQTEYFVILRKIGFYDRMIDEMWNMKLITLEEKAQLEKSKVEADKLKNNK